MNGLLWILLLFCCGNNNGCGCSNNCTTVAENRSSYMENTRSSCSLKDRDEAWTPYMGNASERDNDCGCERNY